VEVLRSGSVSVAGKLGTGSDLPVTSCLLDLLPSVKSAGEEIRTAVDCSSLESASPGLLDKDRSFCTLGKKTLVPSILNFERSKRNTWSKLGLGPDLALGRVVRKVLDPLFGTGPGRRRKGLRLARLIPSSLTYRLSKFLPKRSPKVCSGFSSNRSFSDVSKDFPLDIIEGSPGSGLDIFSSSPLKEPSLLLPVAPAASPASSPAAPLGSVPLPVGAGVDSTVQDSAVSPFPSGSSTSPADEPVACSHHPTFRDDRLDAVWEADVRKKGIEFWERLSLDWALDEGNRQEFLGILDEMIARKKKGPCGCC
jgi:hypothetical protein